MLTQRVPRTTQQCPADQPPRFHVAEAGRGNGQRPPMCVSYPQPGDSNQGQQEESCRLQTRIDCLLQAIDMPRCRVGSLGWEDEDCLPHPQLSQAKQLGQPSFVIAELCGRLVFMTWSPRRMWPQTAVEGGAAW
jgi:hypothetical protein